MQLTLENFDRLWADWQQEPQGAAGPQRDAFRDWLSQALELPLIESGRGRNWVLWGAPAMAPVGTLFRRTRIACILPGQDRDGEAPLRIFQEIRGCAQKGDILLLVPIGASDRFTVLAKRAVTVPCAALFQDDVRGLLFATDPKAALREMLRRHFDLARLNPYSTQGAVVPSMFFQREPEIRRITSARGLPIAVVGQRGIGKSSLLREAHRRVKDAPHARAVYLDCDALSEPGPACLEDELTELMFPKVAASGTRLGIHELAARTGDNVYLFIDEVDRVLEQCDTSLAASAFYGRLRAAAGSPRAVVVLAGWKQLWSTIGDPRHQLYNKLEVLHLGPLGQEDARKLVVQPIESLGLRFESAPETIGFMLRWSSCHPAYLQLLCGRLIDLAHASGKDCLTLDDARSAASDNSLYDAISMPFVQSASSVDKAVTFVAMELGGRFSVADIVRAFGERWQTKATEKPVQKACDRLVAFNVFARANQHYKFLISDFPKMLRRRQPIQDLMGGLLENVAGELSEA